MWSLSLVVSECSLGGRGQGHVSNFYIVDLENFATASRRYTGDIHNLTVVGLFMTPETMGATQSRKCTLSITHCLRLNLQFHTIDFVRTCRISSFCTVAWQLARFQMTRRIALSLGDSWASCWCCMLQHSWITVWLMEYSSALVRKNCTCFALILIQVSMFLYFIFCVKGDSDSILYFVGTVPTIYLLIEAAAGSLIQTGPPIEAGYPNHLYK